MNLLSFSYWFNLRPPFFISWFSYTLLIFLILLLASSAFLKIYLLKYKVDKLLKKGLRKLSDLLLVMSLAGLMLYFFSYEEIYIFSMRLWYIVWLFVALWWAWVVYHYIVIEIPQKRAWQAEREEERKWFKK